MDFCYDEIMSIDFLNNLKTKGMNLENTGVIYLYDVPCKHEITQKIKNSINSYTKIDRQYTLVNKHTDTKELWYEITDKKLAKAFVTKFNGKSLHSDSEHWVWRIKYLHGFKWADLMSIVTHLAQTEEIEKEEEIRMAKHTATEFCSAVFGIDSNEMCDIDPTLEAVPETIKQSTTKEPVLSEREQFFNDIFNS